MRSLSSRAGAIKQIKSSDQYKKAEKFDIVVDGLNLTFANGLAKKNIEKDLESFNLKLLKGLQALKNQGFANVFLIHRTWLQRSKYFVKIKNLCRSHFLLDRQSNDDPFALISALEFGPGTFLASRDLFRQHIFALETQELRSLFFRWQLGHCVTFSQANFSADKNRDRQDSIFYQVRFY